MDFHERSAADMWRSRRALCPVPAAVAHRDEMEAGLDQEDAESVSECGGAIGLGTHTRPGRSDGRATVPGASNFGLATKFGLADVGQRLLLPEAHCCPAGVDVIG